jgi:Fe-S-cluster containining protein
MLFECRPGCGKCCHPRVLALLPRDVDRLAAMAPSQIKDFEAECTHEGASILRELNQKEPFAPCTFLRSDKKCAVYGSRPHPCRLYPFHYTPQGDVGYLEEAPKECPGLYLGKTVKDMGPYLEELAKEVAYGMKTIEELAKAV